MKSKWKTISNDVVYENDWISVEHHEVITPGGNAGVYGVVAFKNIAIGILPIDQEGNTWLVGQYRYALSAYSWEIPMGGGSLDTDPLISAQRELREETGLIAERWSLMMELHTSNSITNEYGLVYIAEGLKMTTSDSDDTEDLTLRKLPFSEVLEMVLEGKITDAISVAAILRYHHLSLR